MKIVSLIVGIAGIAVQFRRRLGRFIVTFAICGAISLLVWQIIAPDQSASNRFYSITNTRSEVWEAMWNQFLANPSATPP